MTSTTEPTPITTAPSSVAAAIGDLAAAERAYLEARSWGRLTDIDAANLRLERARAAAHRVLGTDVDICSGSGIRYEGPECPACGNDVGTTIDGPAGPRLREHVR